MRRMPDKHQYFKGKMFTRDENTGYYLCSTNSSDGRRKRMHVYVWEYYNGPVPAGYHVHHRDEDKSNNNISNLELKTRSEHLSFHAKEEYKRAHDERIRILKEKAIPKAKEWHKSNEGHKWHQDHYEKTKDNLHVDKEFICFCCGKNFVTKANGQTKYCSNNCKSKHRREQGVDNIETECVVCGKKFIKNKYAQTQTCSRKRRTKLCIYNRNQIHW